MKGVFHVKHFLSLFIDKWIKRQCKHLCVFCKWRYECLPSYYDELEKEKNANEREIEKS